MNKKFASIPLAAILIIVLGQSEITAQQADDFKLETIRVSIDVKSDKSFDEVVDTQVRNLRNQKRDISLSSRRSGAQFSTRGRTISSGSLSLAPKAMSLFRRTASGSVEGNNVRRLVADPMVQIGRSTSRSRVSSFQMEVKLPPDAKRIVHASLPATSRTIEGGRAVYRWDYKDTYPVRVFVLYQTTPYELSATKRIASRNGRTIEVEVAIKNLGPTAVQKVRVMDDFPPFLGSPAPGEGYFSESSSAQSEPRLIYSRTIPGIPAGGTAVVSYKLTLTSDEVSLRSSRVYVGEALIVMSNRLEE